MSVSEITVDVFVLISLELKLSRHIPIATFRNVYNNLYYYNIVHNPYLYIKDIIKIGTKIDSIRASARICYSKRERSRGEKLVCTYNYT